MKTFRFAISAAVVLTALALNVHAGENQIPYLENQGTGLKMSKDRTTIQKISIYHYRISNPESRE